MKGDFSRRTFDPRKHYRSVQMQQGRVQLDADWNEQGDIAAHRVETEAQDVVGAHGAPLHEAGFHIVSAVAQLTAEEKDEPGNNPEPMPELAPPGDFFISAGRYYVDGILCGNESITTYLGQPDLPDLEPAPGAGTYLVYLDVWQRHITALDNPLLRETALGGPDTATRVKSVWQVKWLATESGDCPGAFQDLRDALPARDGKLKARAAVPPGDSDLCSLAPSGGYRGLENQLYRVEVHHPGRPYVIPAGDTDVHAVIGMSGSPVDTITAQDGTWSVDDWVEVFGTTSPGGAAEVEVDPMVGYLARVVGVEGTTLMLDRALPDLMDQTPKVRPLGQLNGAHLYATFKWSRDNGTVVTEITKIAAPGASGDTEITVHDLGPDEVLGFAAGQWVEIADDHVELSGQPGQLAQIVSVNPKPVDPVVTVKGKIDPLAAGDSGVDSARHPKLRRWDGIGLVKYLDSGSPENAGKNWQHLEDGVQVQFSAGGYVTGDYWQIPARAVTAEAELGHIEWPGGKDDPEELPPTGIEHHYAPLAILGPDPPRDCRALFPPLTELATLVYVGGDGQEAMPGDALPKPLQVGVFRGRWPVENARVRFTAPSGNGWVAEGPAVPSAGSSTSVDIMTEEDGIAACNWLMDAARNDPATWKTPQQVEARLLDAAGAPLDPVVRFTANLSIAGQVAYHPESNSNLASDDTVQDAVDKLARLTRLYAVAGDGQEATLPHLVVPHLVEVAVANDLGPVAGAQVRFSAEAGFVAPEGADVVASTTHATEPPLTTDPNGVARCQWRLRPGGEATQQLVATLVAASGRPFQTPQQFVVFTGNLVLAQDVLYRPTADCPILHDQKTVQAAIDTLCQSLSRPGTRPRLDFSAVIAGKPLTDGERVRAAEVDEGIVLTVPHASLPLPSINDLTCYVVLELPYPGVPVGTGPAGPAPTPSPCFGPFTPWATIANRLSPDQGTTIRWAPTRRLEEWMSGWFKAAATSPLGGAVRAHFVLKGEALCLEGEPEDWPLRPDIHVWFLIMPE